MAEPINGAEPVSDEIHDIEAYTPMSGRVLGEDGKMYNLVGLLQNAGFNGGSNGGTIFKSVAAYDDLPPPAGEHRDELYFVQTSTGGLFGFIGAYKYPRGFYAVNAEDIWEQVPISVSVSDNAFTIVNITDWAAFRDFTGTVNEKDVVLYGGVLYQNLTGGVTSDPPPDDVDNWVILPQCAGFIDEEALSQYVAEHALLKDEQAADSAMLGGRSPDYYAKATRQIGMGSRESILELFDEFGEGTYMLVAPYTDVGDLPEAISPAATANLILDIKKDT
nr:hypothetical protein [uncultured bacterium]